MNILITGDRGFLGRHLKKKLEGHELYFCNTDNHNLLNYDNLSPLATVKFDFIFHLAAHTKAGDWCLTHPGEQWLINQTINTNILRFWKEFQPQAKMVCMGTSCSYSSNLDVDKVEENYLYGSPEQELYTYAMTKRMLYTGLKSINRQYGLKYLHYIPSTLYGPDFDIKDSHFIFDLIKKIYSGKVTGEPVILWGDGNQKRELIYVEDAIEMIFSTLNIDNVSLNLGSGIEYSIKEYAFMISNLVGYTGKIQFDTNAYTGAISKKLNVSKIKFSSGQFFNNTSITKGLEKTLEYYTGIIK